MRLKPFLADQELCRHASGRVLDACKSAAGRVDESNAIVKKKCDAEAAKSPQQRKEHTAKSAMMDDIIAVLERAPSCDPAMKVFEACEYGTSGDIRIGAMVLTPR
jgi:hypothetical protein